MWGRALMMIPTPLDGGDDVIPCTFKKGVCTLYKLKGDKSTITNKKWAKKKFGYGWKEDSLHLSEWVRVVTIVC